MLPDRMISEFEKQMTQEFSHGLSSRDWLTPPVMYHYFRSYKHIQMESADRVGEICSKMNQNSWACVSVGFMQKHLRGDGKLSSKEPTVSTLNELHDHVEISSTENKPIVSFCSTLKLHQVTSYVWTPTLHLQISICISKHMKDSIVTAVVSLGWNEGLKCTCNEKKNHLTIQIILVLLAEM